MKRRVYRIYVTQYGTTWSLTPEDWRKACELAVANKPFNFDDLGRRLSRQRSKWDLQHEPLDWDQEKWTDELEQLEKER